MRFLVNVMLGNVLIFVDFIVNNLFGVIFKCVVRLLIVRC